MWWYAIVVLSRLVKDFKDNLKLDLIFTCSLKLLDGYLTMSNSEELMN